MSSLTCLHLPFEGDVSNEYGLLITAKINAPPVLGTVRLFDLQRPDTDRITDTSGSVSPTTVFSNNDFTGPWGIQGREFRPRIFFPAASPQVMAVYNQCYTLLDLQRPDICIRRPYLPIDTKALQVARSWNTITQTIPLVYSTAKGLHYALVDTRQPDLARPATQISSRRYDVFDVGQISAETIANRSKDLRVTAVAGRESQLAQFAYCQEYRKPTSLLGLSQKRKAIDVITSFNGWWEIITYRHLLLLLDFTKPPLHANKSVSTPTSHPRHFITHKSASETQLPLELFTAKVPGLRGFVKCEFAEPGSDLPRHFYVVAKTNTFDFALFRVNIRALREGKQMGTAIAVIPGDPRGLLDWSRMDELVSWRDRIWLPTKPTVDLESSAGYIYPAVGDAEHKNKGMEEEDDDEGEGKGDEETTWVSYESLARGTEGRRTDAYVTSLQRAKSLFAGRDEDYWPWDLLHFLASRMKAIVPAEIWQDREFESRGKLQDYIADWRKCFSISVVDEFREGDLVRSGDGFHISLDFNGKTKLFKEASLGCLAATLMCLSRDVEGLQFKDFTSILFGWGVSTPMHLPVFAAHSPNANAYHFSADTTKHLTAPIKRHRRESTAISVSVSPTVIASSVRVDDNFIHKTVPLSSAANLLATHDWDEKPTSFPEELDMYIPRSRCDSTWFDSEGNLQKTAFGPAAIPYPICVPSKEIDACWRVDQWCVGKSAEHCLVLFIRPSQFTAMSTRLNYATFVIVPLEDNGPAYTFTREIIRQWAQHFECPYIYSLDDNIDDLFTVDNTIQETLQKQDWLSAFQMLSVHSRTPGWENVGVWGLQRWDGRSHNKRSETAWIQRHCQCFVLLNIAAFKERGISYIKKDEKDKWQRKVLGMALDEMGPLEDYLLNFACEREGLKVMQNQFYMFRKAERIREGGKLSQAEWNYVTFQESSSAIDCLAVPSGSK